HDILNESSAPIIWEKASNFLQNNDFNVQYILNLMDVNVICTTDDPADGLEHHAEIAANPACKTKVLPTFRPDKALQLSHPQLWNEYLERLSQAACSPCNSFENFLEALHKRHEFFHVRGCRLSDHSFPNCPWPPCSPLEAESLFHQARKGFTIPPSDQNRFAALVLQHIARWNYKRGWILQLHLGALRNTNTRLLRSFGPDAGSDSIGDWPQAENLAAFLDSLDSEGSLPKTILYNLNPSDNYVFATMIGNFQDGSHPGKIQWGSAWWFLDQLEGMRWQINALSNLGLLSHFVGMLTDSRSFLSFPRHEYFRRLLCRIIGTDVENGLIPNDMDLLSNLIRNICYQNARNYFPFWDQ
ncbi:MAG: glucuronate isomerase, partial [Chthoniobacterales bacterium]|nr:glucuronate isomerase [Chthoniobacterales bacterium]